MGGGQGWRAGERHEPSSGSGSGSQGMMQCMERTWSCPFSNPLAAPPNFHFGYYRRMMFVDIGWRMRCSEGK